MGGEDIATEKFMGVVHEIIPGEGCSLGVDEKNGFGIWRNNKVIVKVKDAEGGYFAARKIFEYFACRIFIASGEI